MTEKEIADLRERLNSYGRNVYLFSSFNEYMTPYYVDHLLRLDTINNNEPIKIYINSYGGDVYSLLSIVDAMKAINAPVYTIALGKAMSAGAVLLAAGDKRFVGANTTVMVHGVAYGMGGKISDHEENLVQGKKIEEQLLDIMTAKSNISKENLREAIFKTDLYLTADEAIQYGLADEVLTKEVRNANKLSETSKIIGESYKLSEVEDNKSSKIQLFQTGDYIHPIYEDLTSITSDDLELFKKNFDNKVRGIDISVESTHDNDNGEKPAWGWLKEVYLSNDRKELWADVDFNADAKEELAKGTYKYVSPEFVFDYKSEKGKEFKNVLLGVALTNRPFQKNKAIKLSEAVISDNDNKPNKESKNMSVKMTKDEMFTILNSEHGIDVVALMATAEKVEGMTSEIDGLTAKIIEADAEAVKTEKQAFVTKMITEGKEFPSEEATVLEMFNSVEDMEKFYATRKPVVPMKEIGDEGTSADAKTEAQVQRIQKANPEMTKEAIEAGIAKLKEKEGK